MSNNFEVAETEAFSKKVQARKFREVYQKIIDYVYPLLRKNPYYGPNIKKLKGKLSGFYRYRIGNKRLFYKIDGEKVIVFMTDIGLRKDSYK